jgi:hypothetical protein
MLSARGPFIKGNLIFVKNNGGAMHLLKHNKAKQQMLGRTNT